MILITHLLNVEYYLFALPQRWRLRMESDYLRSRIHEFRLIVFRNGHHHRGNSLKKSMNEVVSKAENQRNRQRHRFRARQPTRNQSQTEWIQCPARQPCQKSLQHKKNSNN